MPCSSSRSLRAPDLTQTPRATLSMLEGFGGDCQAVRQTAYLNTHMNSAP